MKNYWIYLVIIVIILGYSLGLFSIFLPKEDLKLTQYNSESKCQNIGGGWYWYSYPCEGSFQGRPYNIYTESIFSNIVEINLEGHNFKFVAEKTGNGENFGIIKDYPCGTIVPGCFQKVKVYKDNLLIDEIKSWTGDKCSNLDKNFGKNNGFIYYTDASEKIGIRFKIKGDANAEYIAQFFGVCPAIINTYEIIPKDDIIDYTTNYSINGKNLTINLLINSKFYDEVNSNINILLETPTPFGSQKEEINKQIILKKGVNIVGFSKELTTTKEVSITVTPTISASLKGSQFNGLNYFLSTLPIVECYNTRRDGSCEEARFPPSNQPREITDIEWIPLGNFLGDPQIIIVSGSDICNTLADSDCNNKVDRTELGNYISKWIAGTATRENLGNAIQAWVAG